MGTTTRGLSSSSSLINRCLWLALLLPLAAWSALPFLNSQGNELPSLAPMIERASPAVVNISVKGSVEVKQYHPFQNDPFFEHFFNQPNTPNKRDFQSAGSGVIIDAKQGYILTNHHVVNNADEITVTLLDERNLEAEIIGSDKNTDIAVLKVKADQLTAVPLADSEQLRVGDFVVAIGNPFGFNHTVTSGIVSGLGRSGLSQDAYEDFIQTDASINPGNSGGALLNLRGELIGVNSAIISKSGGNLGIGFAIPSNMADSIMRQLVEHGEVKRGLLGVSITTVTPEIAEAYGLKDDRGVLISEVTPSSAADQAGLQAGDVITHVGQTRVETASELRNTIGLKRSGDDVMLSYRRDGKKQSAKAKLANKDNTIAQVAKTQHPGLQGAEFADVQRDQVEGVLVATVQAGSPAAMRGLKSGDIITKINRAPVRSLADFKKAIQTKGVLGLTLVRGKTQLLLPIL